MSRRETLKIAQLEDDIRTARTQVAGYQAGILEAIDLIEGDEVDEGLQVLRELMGVEGKEDVDYE